MARNFKKISTGEFLARFDNLVPPPPAADHIAHVAAEYGIPAADIQLIETATDLSSPATSIKPPPHVPTPDESLRARVTELAQKGILTAPETAELAQKIARYVMHL